ncbi:MAG: hypothetical protein CVV51_11845 [Spirochaetae bacterium HGW-Spirochaetae-7]|nr:MAG: hypothetical protein CVV51_11845 [Spirochaetae bacterium HGW-Spirochaetae-7]
MTGSDADRMLARLARADLGKRLGFRLVAWAVTAFLAWSLALLLAVALPDASVIGLSARGFTVVVMAAISALPAFLAAPLPASAGLEAVRHADREAAIESWLDYHGGPAGQMLEKRAFEALSIAALAGFGRPAPGKAARIAVKAIALAGLVVFVSAQALSLRSGYGVSLSWPDKAVLDLAFNRSGPTAGHYPGIVAEERAVPDNVEPGLPGDRRYAGAGTEDGDPLAQPDFGNAAGGDAEEEGSAAVPPGVRRFEEAMPGEEKRQTAKGTGMSAEGAEVRPADGADRSAGRDASGKAQVPGWEGTGRAIDESPLVDYRARFERQLAETSGTETTLGSKPSAEVVSEAIAEYYASFDARVALERPVDPGLALAMQVWMDAFGSEASP